MTNKTTSEPIFTNYQKIVLALLALLQFSVVLDFMIISPIGDILKKDLDITIEQFGWVVSAYAFSAGASGIIAAGFIDKFDRKKILIFFFTGFIIGTLFCALANTYYTLFAARLITGLFGGVISSITLTIVSDLFAINQRGRAMSTVQMAFSASQVLGIPLGIFIANHLGWHYVFSLIVVFALLILAVIIFKMKPIDEHLKVKSDKKPLVHLWHTVKNPQYRVGFLGIALLTIGGFMLMPFTSIFLVNNIHITNKELPLIFMVTGASTFITMPLLGRLSDKFSKYKIFLFGSILAIIMILIYTNMSPVPLWVMMIANVILFAGLLGRMVPFQALNTMIPNQTDRGAYMGISSSLQQIAGGLGAIIASQIAFQATPKSPLQNFDILGYVVAGLALICMYLVYRVNIIAKENVQKQERV